MLDGKLTLAISEDNSAGTGKQYRSARSHYRDRVSTLMPTFSSKESRHEIIAAQGLEPRNPSGVHVYPLEWHLIVVLTLYFTVT